MQILSVIYNSLFYNSTIANLNEILQKKDVQGVVTYLSTNPNTDITVPHDEGRYSPLLQAVDTNDEKMIEALLENGKIQKRPEEIYDAYLFALSSGKSVAAATLLKRCGKLIDLSKLDQNDEIPIGITHLRVAIQKLYDARNFPPRSIEHSEELVSTLIEKNCFQLNTQNKDGKTILHTAAFFGQAKTIEKLIQKGADKSICSNEKGSPLQLYRSIHKEQTNPEILKLLANSSSL